MDVNFLGELESIFREEFLKAAPLYSAASKVKLPYEDIRTFTKLYEGSLSEQSRPVELFADYRVASDPAQFKDKIVDLATAVGHGVDAFIRLENVDSNQGGDPRDTTNLKVTDIFEHSDGRRNLQIGIMKVGPTLMSPAREEESWVFYRFYFAAASIKAEYKH